MIHRRSRGFTLIEFLAVMFLVSICGTIMSVGIVSVIRTHRQIADLTNRYAGLNDFLRCIREDVRAASGIALDSDGEKAATTLALTHTDPKAHTEYRFFDNRIERLRSSRGSDVLTDKVWSLDHSAVDVALAHPSDEATLLRLAVRWHSPSKDDTQPGRLFEMTLRPAGERIHEPD